MSHIGSHCLERILFALQAAAQLAAAADASATMFWTGLSDEAPSEPPISAQLSANLECAGLLDAAWLLGAQLGIRTCRSLLELTTEELDVCCMRLACAGFGPGHAEALRTLHAGGLGENLQPRAHLGNLAATPQASGDRFAHSTSEVLLAKVTETRSLVFALHLAVGMEVAGTGHVPGGNMVMEQCLNVYQALCTLEFQTMCDEASREASGAPLTQDLGQPGEKLAGLALWSSEQIGVALAARRDGSPVAKQQAEVWGAVRVAMHELLVLVCARPLPLEAVSGRGLGAALKNRVLHAISLELAATDVHAFTSRVGKAKWHLFNLDKRSGKAPKQRREATAWSTGEAAPASSSGAAASAASTQVAAADMASGEVVEEEAFSVSHFGESVGFDLEDLQVV